MGWMVWESNPGGGETFHACPDWTWGPPSLLYKGYWFFPRVKQPGRGVDRPPPSGAKVKERIELYLQSPLDLHGLFQVELYLFYLYLSLHKCDFINSHENIQWWQVWTLWGPWCWSASANPSVTNSDIQGFLYLITEVGWSTTLLKQNSTSSFVFSATKLWKETQPGGGFPWQCYTNTAFFADRRNFNKYKG